MKMMKIHTDEHDDDDVNDDYDCDDSCATDRDCNTDKLVYDSLLQRENSDKLLLNRIIRQYMT